METMKEAWAKPISRSPCYVWEQNLKVAKQALKEWIKKTHYKSNQLKERNSADFGGNTS